MKFDEIKQYVQRQATRKEVEELYDVLRLRLAILDSLSMANIMVGDTVIVQLKGSKLRGKYATVNSVNKGKLSITLTEPYYNNRGRMCQNWIIPASAAEKVDIVVEVAASG